MKLDIKNNELVFTNIPSVSTLKTALKDIPYRETKQAFYVPLQHIELTRLRLEHQSKMMILSEKYMKFAQKFIINKQPLHFDWYPAICRVSGQGMPWGEVLEATSFFTKDSLRSQAYEKGRWSGFVHLFDVVKGEFPAGLLERIVKILRRHKIPFTSKRHFDYPKPIYQFRPSFPFEPTSDQIEAVNALDRMNFGIGKCPTGFGKTSFVAAALIAKKGVKSMFLANQKILIKDAARDFEEIFAGNDITIGKIGEGIYAPGDITVASIQGIVAALHPPSQMEWRIAEEELKEAELRENKARITRAKKKLAGYKERAERAEHIRPLLESIQLFIVDESQVLGTDMWNTFLHACPAPYRYTLSATDTRNDGGRVMIVAATGERRFESSAEEQIQKGRLAEFRATFQRFDHNVPEDVLKKMDVEYDQAYRHFIMENEERNRLLCKKTIEWAKEGHSILALVTRLEHAEIIKGLLTEMGLEPGVEEAVREKGGGVSYKLSGDFHIVHGKTTKSKREAVIESFRRSEFPVLIGSSIFDVGFNAKNAAKMVRFNAGASETREVQRAGRTVRKRADESIGEMFDVLDVNVPFFQSQSWKRIKLLQAEFGSHRVIIGKGFIVSQKEYSTLVEREKELKVKENEFSFITENNEMEEFLQTLRGQGIIC